MRDAERLVTAARSPDQALHLVGFGPECARKALLDPRQSLSQRERQGINQSIGHRFDGAEEGMISWARALTPESRDLPAVDWSQRYPRLREWNPERRYEATGTAARKDPARLQALFAEARAAVDDVTAVLWLRGVGSGDPR